MAVRSIHKVLTLLVWDGPADRPSKPVNYITCVKRQAFTFVMKGEISERSKEHIHTSINVYMPPEHVGVAVASSRMRIYETS